MQISVGTIVTLSSDQGHFSLEHGLLVLLVNQLDCVLLYQFVYHFLDVGVIEGSDDLLSFISASLLDHLVELVLDGSQDSSYLPLG